MNYERLIGLLAGGVKDTLYMALWSTFFAVLIGFTLGIVLHVSQKSTVLYKRIIYTVVSLIVNIGRSVPFIILLIAIIPFTRWLTGSALGSRAAVVPLALSGAPFFARLVESNLAEVPYGLIEAARSFGASTRQIVFFVLLPEAKSALILSVTNLLVNLVGYSAMAGAIGAGGLGKLAITYGYNRYNSVMMLWTVVLLVILVQIIQAIGGFLGQKFNHKKR